MPLTKETKPIIVGWLVGFYGMSTITDYLMPNPFYSSILNMYDCKRILYKSF